MNISSKLANSRVFSLLAYRQRTRNFSSQSESHIISSDNRNVNRTQTINSYAIDSTSTHSNTSHIANSANSSGADFTTDHLKNLTQPAVIFRLAPLFWAVGTFIIFTLFTIYQWGLLESWSWDEGIFAQLVRKYAMLQTPIVDIKGPGYHLWGDHFSPILLLLTPFYWLLPSGITPALVQNLLFAGAVYALAKLAYQQCAGWLASVLSFSFCLSWGIQSAVEVQFHEIAFATFLLAWAIRYAIEQKWQVAFYWFLPLVFCKEDIGVTVLVAGLVLGFLVHRGEVKFPKAKFYAIFLSAWGVFWLVMAVWVIIPFFNVHGAYDYTSQVTNTSLTTMLLTGLPEKFLLLFGLGASLGILGVITPYAWLILPTITWRFIGNVPFYWGFGWQYSAVLMPMVFASMFYVIQALGWAKPCKLRVNVQADLEIEKHVSAKPKTTLTKPRIWWVSPTSKTVTVGLATVTLLVNITMNLCLLPGKPTWRVFTNNITPYLTLQPALLTEPYRIIDMTKTLLGREPKVVSDTGTLAYLVPTAQVFWVGSITQQVIPDLVLHNRHYYLPVEGLINKYGGKWKTIYINDVFELTLSMELYEKLEMAGYKWPQY